MSEDRSRPPILLSNGKDSPVGGDTSTSHRSDIDGHDRVPKVAYFEVETSEDGSDLQQLKRSRCINAGQPCWIPGPDTDEDDGPDEASLLYIPVVEEQQSKDKEPSMSENGEPCVISSRKKRELPSRKSQGAEKFWDPARVSDSKRRAMGKDFEESYGSAFTASLLDDIDWNFDDDSIPERRPEPHIVQIELFPVEDFEDQIPESTPNLQSVSLGLISPNDESS
ncbi:hypothetical protein HWV62_12234 [Athelia sp. TMB]|nr:hypothetical protein HWV62_12234 [Athelia sp. TMB]